MNSESPELNNFERERFNVRNAVKEDIEEILRIQNERLLDNEKHGDDLIENGFLVNPISAQDLNEAIDHPETSFLYIAQDKNNSTVGYLLAYDFLSFVKEHPEWKKEVGPLSLNLESEKVIYGKHVAIDKSAMGAGSALEENFFQASKKNGYSLFIGEICEGPIENKRSVDFHTKKFDLNKIGSYQDGNKYSWGIYAKKL